MEKFLTNLLINAKPIFVKRHSALFHKTPNDLLSEADVELNNYFVSAIKNEYKNAHIIAEESENESLTDELTFVIDPLDGTCNYSMQIPLCGMQIAVLEHKEVIMSFIYLPNSDEMYVAKKGEGAFLNGQRITADKSIKHNDGVLLTSDYYLEEKDISLENQYLLTKELKLDFLKTRLLGASCVDFSYLATSKAQAYICYYRQIWDIAPGLLLAKEAGLLVKRINGFDYHFNDESIVIANNEETLDLILSKAKQFIK